jgi:hypothetical protein
MKRKPGRMSTGGKTLGIRERFSIIIPKVQVYDATLQTIREEETVRFITMAARLMADIERTERPVTTHAGTQTAPQPTPQTADFQCQLEPWDFICYTDYNDDDYSTDNPTSPLHHE